MQRTCTFVLLGGFFISCSSADRERDAPRAAPNADILDCDEKTRCLIKGDETYDRRQSAAYFTRACELGAREGCTALYEIALGYAHGSDSLGARARALPARSMGSPKNSERALELFHEACALEEGMSCIWVHNLLAQAGSLEEAISFGHRGIDYLFRKCDRGNEKACDEHYHFKLVLAMTEKKLRADKVRPKLLVLPMKKRNRPAGTESLDAVVLAAAHNAVTHEVISEGDIAALLSVEVKKDLLGCDDVACYAEIGNALNAQHLLSVDLAPIEDEWLLTITVIDSHKVEVLVREATQVVADDLTFVTPKAVETVLVQAYKGVSDE